MLNTNQAPALAYARMLFTAIAATLVTTLLTTVVTSTGTAFAFEEPQHEHAHEFQHSSLWWGSVYEPVSALRSQDAADLLPRLNRLNVSSEHAFIDRRNGRFGTLIITRPMIPGPGVGNDLTWTDAGRSAPANYNELLDSAWDAFRGFLVEHSADLQFNPVEFDQPNLSTPDERLIQIHVPRRYQGIPVRDSFITAIINSGNLVLMGQRNWADINLSAQPEISADQARNVLLGHLGRDQLWPTIHTPHLEFIPVSDQPDEEQISAIGQGLEYRLVWVLQTPLYSPDDYHEALIDAMNGELLALTDMKHYSTRKVGGGVYPVSNDGIPPDGIEQPGWPMPFANIRINGSNAGYTTSGGHLPAGADSGTITTTLSGQYVRMDDRCGAISESAASDDLDLGHGPGTDCAVPPGGSPGNTHASRSGFYELNRIAEQGRGYLPNNSWLQSQLTANMNVNNNCNATYSTISGQVTFYTSGGGCANTGEIAGVFDHEWGHGMDHHSNIPVISRPGEGIADMYAQNRLNDSCVGRGFRPGQNCTGFGDACLACTGVRESDWAKRASGQPHDVAWIQASCPSAAGSTGPCNRSTHCEGNIVAEAAWDLIHRDLQGFDGSDINFDLNTALELGTRLTFLGAANVNNWFQCTANGQAGCNADGGYLNFLAADDDNGDLTDGTPHMSALFAAFDRHGIACSTPAVQDSGCSNTPAAPGNVQVSSRDQGARLSWDSVPHASEYWIYRTEGVHGCDFGKTRVAAVSTTEFTDFGLRNDMEAFYSVVAVGANSACTSPMSACQAVMPSDIATGVIHGTLTRADTDLPLSGALVTASNADESYTATSAADGNYQLVVPEGIYQLLAEKEGHESATVSAVEVNEDDLIAVDLGLDTPIVHASPASFSLLAVQGYGAVTTLQLENLGSLTLNWATDSDTPSGFCPEQDWLASVPDSGQLEAGSSTSIEITADAADLTAGNHAANLCLYTNDSESRLRVLPVQLTVQEEVAGQIALDAETLDFGEVDAGQSASQTLLVSNAGIPGAEAIELDSLVISQAGEEYAISGGDCAAGLVLETGQACELEIAFAPLSEAAFDAGLQISLISGPGASVSLSGIGLQPPGQLEMDSNSLQFGEVGLGSAVSQNLVLSNVADIYSADLLITQAEVIVGSSVFELTDSDCDSPLEPQQSCLMEVRFTPNVLENQLGVLRILIDGEAFNINLAGRGVEPPPVVFEDRFEN